MLTKTDLQDWLDGLPDDFALSIENRGRFLFYLNADAYIEIGGTPEEEYIKTNYFDSTGKVVMPV